MSTVIPAGQARSTPRAWVETVLGHADFDLTPASEDASFRRYFRVRVLDDSWILMDAPPELENSGPFVDVAERLLDARLNAPRILNADLDQGFLLLTDLGATSYLDALWLDSQSQSNPVGQPGAQAEGHPDARELYEAAIGALVIFQARVSTRGLARYDRAELEREMRLLPDWFLRHLLGQAPSPATERVLQQAFDFLVDSCLAQPRVFVHRDYHSRNLMALPSGSPGIIDFQDALEGPVGYDLASLLLDAYVDWSEPARAAWIARYGDLAVARGIIDDGARDLLPRWVDLASAQRQIKIAGIFARLFYRDGKARYLGDVPRVLGYLAGIAGRYGELEPLAKLMEAEQWIERAGAVAERVRSQSPDPGDPLAAGPGRRDTPGMDPVAAARFGEAPPGPAPIPAGGDADARRGEC